MLPWLCQQGDMDMALGIISPRITCTRDIDGTWTAVLFIEGKRWAELGGFKSQHAARAAIRKKYL
jgi:hypothetical protein